MTYLVAAVVTIGVVSLFHLTLTMGIIRRLREQEAEQAELARRNDPQAESPTVGVGRRVGGFDATADDGSPVAWPGDGRRLTAFFTPDCKACAQQLPQFAAFAAGFAGDVVAVIVVDEVAQALAYQEKLAGVARTVAETTDGAVVKAFAVTSYPAIAVTDAQGVVLATGNTVGDVAVIGEVVAVP